MEAKEEGIWDFFIPFFFCKVNFFFFIDLKFILLVFKVIMYFNVMLCVQIIDVITMNN